MNNPFTGIIQSLISIAELLRENETLARRAEDAASRLKRYEKREQKFDLQDEMAKAGERNGIDPRHYFIHNIIVNSGSGLTEVTIQNILTGHQSVGKSRCNFSDEDVFDTARGIVIALHASFRNLS